MLVLACGQLLTLRGLGNTEKANEIQEKINHVMKHDQCRIALSTVVEHMNAHFYLVIG